MLFWIKISFLFLSLIPRFLGQNQNQCFEDIPNCPSKDSLWIKESWWDGLGERLLEPIQLNPGSIAYQVCKTGINERSCCNESVLSKYLETWPVWARTNVLISPGDISLFDQTSRLSQQSSSALSEILLEDAKEALQKFQQEFAVFIIQSKDSLPNCQNSFLEYQAGLVCLTCDADYVNYLTFDEEENDWKIALSSQDCDYFANSCTRLIEATSRINVAIYNLLYTLQKEVTIQQLKDLINATLDEKPFYCYGDQCKDKACSMFSGLAKPTFIELQSSLFNLYLSYATVTANFSPTSRSTTTTTTTGSNKRSISDQVEFLYQYLDIFYQFHKSVQSITLKPETNKEKRATNDCVITNTYGSQDVTYFAHLEGVKTEFYKNFASSSSSLGLFFPLMLITMFSFFLLI